jgi:competence protein ComEC
MAAEADARVRGWALASHIAVASAMPGIVNTVGNVRWRVVTDLTSARVVAVDVAGISALVAGDMDAADEAELVTQIHPLRADLLVVPHHGAAQSTAFLDAVRPRVAVISVGRGNSQHDPSTSVLEALSSAGSRISRTDQDGDIAISVDAGILRVATRLGPANVTVGQGLRGIAGPPTQAPTS